MNNTLPVTDVAGSFFNAGLRNASQDDGFTDMPVMI